MSTWDAARLASRRQLPKPRKMHGPVGEPVSACEGEQDARHGSPHQRIFFAMGECSTCPDCGYHVCSCEQFDPIAIGVAMLKAKVLEHPDYALSTMLYLRQQDVVTMPHYRKIYASPTTLKAFTEELESCRSDAPEPPMDNGPIEPVDPYASYARDADAQFSPGIGIQAYLKYARLCAEQQSRVSGLNSALFGIDASPENSSIWKPIEPKLEKAGVPVRVASFDTISLQDEIDKILIPEAE